MTLHNQDKGPLQTQKDANGRSNATCAVVSAGICGFTCHIKARKLGKNAVGLEITESECQQIQAFAETVTGLTLKKLFAPVTRNPVYLAAEDSGCHPSCPVPAAVLKAAEVAMEMALPMDATIHFEPCGRKKD